MTEQTSRRVSCVLGRHPTVRVPVPTFTSQYHPGEIVQQTVDALINANQEFGWIREALEQEPARYKIACFWKRTGGKSKGKPRFYSTTMAGGKAKYLTGATWFIDMSADHCAGLNWLDFEAQVYRALCHLTELENEGREGKPQTYTPGIRDFDAAFFLDEIRRYGPHTPDIRSAEDEIAKQLKLDLSAVKSKPQSAAEKEAAYQVAAARERDGAIFDELEGDVIVPDQAAPQPTPINKPRRAKSTDTPPATANA